MTAGRLWFVEVLVWILVALAVVCWLPAADRLERRRPFAFAAAFLALGLALRYDVFGLDMGRDAWFTVLAFWFFAVGWAAAKSTTMWQRIAVTVVLVVSLYGYFDSTNREVLVLAGFALLIWLPAIRCPACVHRRRGHRGGGVAVHLSHALSGLSAVRRPSRAGCRRRRGVRCTAHAVDDGDTHMAYDSGTSAALSRILFPLCDKALLHQGGRDDTVGADEAGRHDPTATRGGR